MGPMWPFVLMYGSHDMRHRFPHVDGGQRDPQKMGRHTCPFTKNSCMEKQKIGCPTGYTLLHYISIVKEATIWTITK